MSDAIREWQRGVVAIGVHNLARPILKGTGFVVDNEARLIVTCAHVVLDAYYDRDEGFDPGKTDEGLAVGVGGLNDGEQIDWRYRAVLRYMSRPPTAYVRGPPPEHWGGVDYSSKRLDLAILELVDAAQIECALSLDLPPSTLSQGDELVLLGYGQSDSGRGAERTVTTMRGYFAGSYTADGHWLKVDVRSSTVAIK